MGDKDVKDLKNNIILPGKEENYPVRVPGDELPPDIEAVAEQLSSRVIGQDRPIRKALRYVTIYEAQLNDPKRPAGILMLAGPSGVGKTHFAKEFAYAWIGPAKKGITPWVYIDCNALSLEHTVSSLTGAPPGYIGYKDQGNIEQVGQYEKDDLIGRWVSKNGLRLNQMSALRPDLIDRLELFFEEIELEREAPRCVVIFDEIEKASKNIQKQLLTIMEEGKLALLNGRVVDFRGSFIIFTTNVGTSQVIGEYLDERRLGFTLPRKQGLAQIDDLNEAIYRRVLDEIEDPNKLHFLPEFLGRIGKPGIVVFHVLQYEHYRKILNLIFEEQINDLLGRDPAKSIYASYTPRLETFLIGEGVSPRYGARALRSVIEQYIKTEIAVRLLNGGIVPQDTVLLDVEFENPGEEDRKKRGAKIIVRRGERLEGIAIKPIESREESRKNLVKRRKNSEKALDAFFDELWSELQTSLLGSGPDLFGKK